jgi:hypothetical protein
MAFMILPLCIEPLCKITSSAQNVYALMSNISSYSSSYPNVIIALKRLDIESSVKILENLIKELDIKHKTKTIMESIRSLKECIQNIENELCIVHEKLAYNKTIWMLKNIRSYKCTNSIINLEILKQQLDNRTQMFFYILNNNNHLSIKVDDPELSIID